MASSWAVVALGIVSVVSLVVISDAGETDHTYYYEDGYLSDWGANQWQGTGMQPHQPKCVDIPADLTLCQNIGYTKMRLPNLLEHDTMEEVKEQARAWVSLKRLQCHQDTQLFLCSLFSPVCLPRHIWPCRSLCESVKRGCESRMSKYGYPWPEMLKCDKFPLDNDMCIMPQEHDKTDDNKCESCNQPNTLEAIIDNYCSAEFGSTPPCAINRLLGAKGSFDLPLIGPCSSQGEECTGYQIMVKIKLKEEVVNGDDVKLISFQNNRAYKKGSLKKRDVNQMTVYIEGGAQCDCPTIDTSVKKAYYMIMGHRKGKRLVASFVQVYDKGGDMKKALRKIRKDKDICDGGADVISPSGHSTGKDKDDEPEIPENVEEVQVEKKADNEKKSERRKKERGDRDGKPRRTSRRRKKDKDVGKKKRARQDPVAVIPPENENAASRHTGHT